MREGIIAGGNFIIDKVKIIDSWPGQESLSNIISESACNGGGPYNVLKDLANMGVNFPLEAIGLVGNDQNGESIIQDCKANGINTNQITKTNLAATSYTDVMSVKEDGKRTFFHNRGANAHIDIEHFNFQNTNSRIFHLAYLMLLDELDKIDGNGRTKASFVLEKAKINGLVTSADLVSVNSDRFSAVVIPALPYVDYLFINEFEAEKITGIFTTKDNKIDLDSCKLACKKILEYGVNEWVILHFPKGAVAISSRGVSLEQNSLALPKDYIKGAVGAGDAFAAGVLFGIHNEWEMQKSLHLGVCVAVACLSHPSSSDGVVHWEKCLTIGR